MTLGWLNPSIRFWALPKRRDEQQKRIFLGACAFGRVAQRDALYNPCTPNDRTRVVCQGYARTNTGRQTLLNGPVGRHLSDTRKQAWSSEVRDESH